MANVGTSWFEVDREGLSKIMTRGGPRSFLIFEPVQNAWDEASENVDVTFEYDEKTETALITVRDDNPEGFKNLAHAYTLFAESDKKGDPNKRGRFNIGEKLVIASCITASIRTTKGCIEFNPDGTRVTTSEIKTAKGSIFIGKVKMEHDEYVHICNQAWKLISPKLIKTTFNGKRLPDRKLLKEFRCSLATEITDVEGNFRPTERICIVHVYAAFYGKNSTIYEMGIPIVEIDDKYDIDIQQKVPLSIDRSNVTPAYLRRLRTKVLNETISLLSKEDVTEPWVQEASSQKDCTDEAITKVVELKYGQDRVSRDMGDPEANGIAMSRGYTVVSGGSLSKGQWKNVRRAGAIKPAGQVTPSPKVYSSGGRKLICIPICEWSSNMKKVMEFARTMASALMHIEIETKIANDVELKARATYGPGGPLVFNLRHLGHAFFNDFPSNRQKVMELLIHEFGHQYSSDHLSSDYHNALCRLGAAAVELALKDQMECKV